MIKMEEEGEGDVAVNQLEAPLITSFKINKRGRLKKAVQEVYLRNDIKCGFNGCILCGNPTDTQGKP